MPDTLVSLPRFLAHLNSDPNPQSALRSLVHGPLLGFGTCGAQLWRLHSQALVSVASIGLTRDEADRYAVIPAIIDADLWRAVRTGQVVVTTEGGGGHAAQGNHFAQLDREYWQGLITRLHGHSVVRVPVSHSGSSVGAPGLILDRPWRADAHGDGVLTATAAALALWMSNPHSGVDGLAAANRSRGGSTSLNFTERQCAILRLVADDQSNPAIAVALNTSESSVKQDLQHAMRALNTRSRSLAAQRARDLGLI